MAHGKEPRVGSGAKCDALGLAGAGDGGTLPVNASFPRVERLSTVFDGRNGCFDVPGSGTCSMGLEPQVRE